jgi:HEAT repeat protein
VNYANVFACQYARLVWLLLHDPRNIEEQKDALRAARAVVGDGPVTIARRGSRVYANGQTLPDTLAAAPEFASQMRAHGIRVMAITSGAPPADLLAAARLLATAGTSGDGGRNAHEKLAAIKTTAVQFALEDASLAPALDDKIPEASTPLAVPVPGGRTRQKGGGPLTPAIGLEIVDEKGMWRHFRAESVPTEGTEELLAQLDAAETAGDAARIIDDLATLAEHALRDGRTHIVAVICGALARREASRDHERFRQTYAMALRRLMRPALLRSIAQLLPRKKEMAPDIRAVLMRAGEDGADAVIELLAQESLASDRRCYLEVLPKLQAGVPTLVHMLGDARWFVVRNAVDLLGEMRVESAESALLPLLQHADDRVRRSAANALINLGTTNGFRAVCEMFQAESPRTRVDAAAALASRRDERSTATLRTVLEDEPDTEVQFALLAALGKIATPAAVEQLVRAAEPKRRLLERKSLQFRIAAVQALGEARTPAALAALAVLREDKEREIREAADRAYQHASRVAEA